MVLNLDNIIYIGDGLFLTISLTVISLLIGLFFGIIISILRYNNIAKYIITKFISIIRGTPLMLQLSLVYFAVPSLFQIKLSVFMAGVIAFGINSTAYMAEILRSGIESLSKGQFEACATLYIPKYFMWKDIILPQVLRNIFPSLVNESIALLKETALIGTISGMDIMRKAQSLSAEQFTYFGPLFTAATYYYLLVLFIEYLAKIIERSKWYVKN